MWAVFTSAFFFPTMFFPFLLSRVFSDGPSVSSWSMTSVSVAARSKRRTATSANTAASRSACQWACPTTVSPAGQGRSGQRFKRSCTHIYTHMHTHTHAYTTHSHTLTCMVLTTCKYTLHYYTVSTTVVQMQKKTEQARTHIISTNKHVTPQFGVKLHVKASQKLETNPGC